MKKGDKIGIVCCSDLREYREKDKIQKLSQKLLSMGFEVVFGKCIYKDNVKINEAYEKASDLMRFFEDTSIKAIFDISGGNLANEILTLLDYKTIKNNPKYFFGYSDLTTVLNALYSQCSLKSVLYQIKNIVGENAEAQSREFEKFVFDNSSELFSFKTQFVVGTHLCGTVVGGNIRCLLKLAGTEYFPSMKDKVLFLEANSGGPNLIRTYFSQLEQMNVFSQINGIILGTFTECESKNLTPTASQIAQNITKGKIPIAKTFQVGHLQNSKAIIIGEKICI